MRLIPVDASRSVPFGPGLIRPILRVVVGLAVVLASTSAAHGDPARRVTPRPPVVDLAPIVEAIGTDLKAARDDLATLRSEVASLGSRVDAITSTGNAIKGIAEPMREEVRGLYVETSNVRSEIARLEETWAANTEALARSRYVLTLLLVATAALQLVVLAVLLRSR